MHFRTQISKHNFLEFRIKLSIKTFLTLGSNLMFIYCLESHRFLPFCDGSHAESRYSVGVVLKPALLQTHSNRSYVFRQNSFFVTPTQSYVVCCSPQIVIIQAFFGHLVGTTWREKIYLVIWFSIYSVLWILST